MCDEVTKSKNVTESRKCDDAVTTSPRPWRVNGHSIEANDPDGLWLQNEKTGCGVVANLPSCPKSRMSKKNREAWDAIVEANARLIVDAVNERDRLNEDIESWRRGYIKARTERNAFLGQRDRLRDIVRRLADMAENLLANYECRYREDRNSMAFVENARGFLNEARSTIGMERSKT